MKARTFLSIFILLFAVVISVESSADSRKATKERDGVNQEKFFQVVRSGDYDKVERLLEAGADVNVQNNMGVTALMVSVAAGHLEISKLLIEKGTDIDIQDNDGTTVLMYALQGGLSEGAGLIIEKGANVHIRNNKGQNALMFASQYSHLDIARLLIEAAGADVNTQADMGTTALMYASQFGTKAVAKFLIESGAQVDARDTQGATALIVASATGNIEVVKLLIEEGADVDARLNNGYTALMIALTNKNTELVDLLWNRIIAVAQESGESSYLPFTIDQEDIDEIAHLSSANDIQSKPYKMTIKKEMAIPARVKYVPLTARKNEKMVNDFIGDMRNVSDMTEMQGKEYVICGPYLTALLMRGNVLPTLHHSTVIAKVSGKYPFVAVYCAINGDSIPIALSLVRNLIFTGESFTVRKLIERELDWYWTTITWDVTEPIFMFENERHKVMVDFSEDGKIYYVDLFDSLKWGND